MPHRTEFLIDLETERVPENVLFSQRDISAVFKCRDNELIFVHQAAPFGLLSRGLSLLN